MIPKILHRIWFGKNEKSDLIKRCIETQNHYFSDYEIMEWTDDNCDLEINEYCKGALSYKMWSSLSDFYRCKVLYEYGGIYLDCDVEVLKPFDTFLDCDFFGSYMDTGPNAGHVSIRNMITINEGVIGSIPKHRIPYETVRSYNRKKYSLTDANCGKVYMYLTEKLKPLLLGEGFSFRDKYERINDIVMYPTPILCPTCQGMVEEVGQDAFAIHHLTVSWIDSLTAALDMEENYVHSE